MKSVCPQLLLFGLWSNFKLAVYHAKIGAFDGMVYDAASCVTCSTSKDGKEKYCVLVKNGGSHEGNPAKYTVNFNMAKSGCTTYAS